MRSHDREPIVIQRDVPAVIIPAGFTVTLRQGMPGYITQALGGSFTVSVEGNLFRIAGDDGDAIGRDPLPKPELPEGATDANVLELAWAQLRTCFDPEIPINVVDLGLIYDCTITPQADGTRHIDVRMTLTAPGCGMGEVLVADAHDKIAMIPTVSEVNVELVFDPPWNHSMMSETARLETGMMF